MSHPGHQTVVLTLGPDETPEQREEFQAAVQDLATMHNAEVTDVAAEFSISEDDASKIVYLRSRSRWTQDREDHLVQLARQGLPLPNVYAGEDDEE